MPKLLIIDDEADIRKSAQNFFKKRGVETFIAANGRDGIDIIAAQCPDLVLLDMRMEGMTGIEVLREVRSKNLLTKVIMVTGVEDMEVTLEAQDLGVLDFVHKPLNLSELKNAADALDNCVWQRRL